MESTAKWVFTPGDGASPPALTGRAAEQAVLNRCLGGLLEGVPPPHNVVLIGPRGNGKTVLLNWFKQSCAQRKGEVDVASLVPTAIPDRQQLVEALSPRRSLAKLLPKKVGVASVGTAEWSSADAQRDLAEVLIRRCRRRPLAVLLDEAHALDGDVGATLLNASQQVRAAQEPFLLVLAGTPGLPSRLDAMDASFWSRLGQGELGIGRLTEEAAREALTEPLREHGVTVDADALDVVVGHSQAYPYFVQIWGDALWQRLLATGTSEVTARLVEEERPSVAVQMANYYQRRFAELEGEGLVEAASAVAHLFQNETQASDQDIDAALLSAGIDDTSARFAAREALNRIGYVWRPPGQLPPVAWQAGIPSLMTHVLQQRDDSTSP